MYLVLNHSKYILNKKCLWSKILLRYMVTNMAYRGSRWFLHSVPSLDKSAKTKKRISKAEGRPGCSCHWECHCKSNHTTKKAKESQHGWFICLALPSSQTLVKQKRTNKLLVESQVSLNTLWGKLKYVQLSIDFNIKIILFMFEASVCLQPYQSWISTQCIICIFHSMSKWMKYMIRIICKGVM